MWKVRGCFGKFSVLCNRRISVEKMLPCVPMEKFFFSTGCISRIFLVNKGLVVSYLSPTGRFGGGGHCVCLVVRYGFTNGRIQDKCVF